MNNILNKNSLIGALIILLLLTSWWGQSQTGANKQLRKDKEAAEALLATEEAKAANTRQALQEKTAALSNAEEKLNKKEQNIQRLGKELSTQKAALATFEKEEKILLKKIKELDFSLNKARTQQEQAGSQQQNLQEFPNSHQETLVKLEKAQAQVAQLEKEQAELKTETEARIAQLQKKEGEAATEVESLSAQVIGFEKVVEERNAALAELGSELDACKVNTKVLLSKISEQENAQQGMEEKMRLMVQNLSEESAHEETIPEQKEQPTDAE
ncbi:MAG: hypothetical protein WGN25_15325 [Candidatus Electrothrix sp. GW3-4]|uniref:hypothetical protein n=1 Tax=Candidatus Electrothrix sp. GW3-4 TaxID=3126740 RepID=UPI0030CE5AE9